MGLSHSQHRPTSDLPLYNEKRGPRVPMPSHWRLPENFVGRTLFSSLCMTAFGQEDLSTLWESCQPGPRSDELFEKAKWRIVDRISFVTMVMAALFVATSLYATTVPPIVPIINYNLRGPYVLILLSLGFELGGLITGCTLVWILYESTRRRFLASFMASRGKTWSSLLLLGYPFFSVGASITFTSLGMLIAIWTAIDKLCEVGAAFVLAAPVFLLAGLMIVSSPSKSAIKRLEERERPISTGTTVVEGSGSVTPTAEDGSV